MSQLNTQHFSAAVIRLPHNDISDVFSVTQPTSGRIDVKRCGSPHSPTVQLRIKLTDVVVTITDALAYGSVELVTLAANANHSINNAAASLTLLKSAGIIDTAASVDWGVGTAAASAATIASTMVNVIQKVDVAAMTVAAMSVNGYMTTAYIGQAASTKLYLNFGIITGTDITADATMTVNGEIIINLSSVYADRTT